MSGVPPTSATRSATIFRPTMRRACANEDPRRKGERPDLADKIIVPDVLIQPHSAPLQIAFYTGSQFPADYRGSAFVALHGSWNRGVRTGYKIVRAPLDGSGKASGAY